MAMRRVLNQALAMPAVRSAPLRAAQMAMPARVLSTSTLQKSPFPSQLQEFSVVYTDRALNHMSTEFQAVMNDMNHMLKEAYNAETAVIIPGSGTYAMEACARQFGTGKKTMVLRNGYFSYRWTQIFEQGDIPSSNTVMMARPAPGQENEQRPAMAPCPVDEVVAKIREEKPDVVFAPQVETSTGIIIPDDYIKTVSDAVHEHGGLFVLDCIASGTVWADMKATGVDALITAPQKGWTGPACAGIVMLGEKGLEAVEADNSGSFSISLKKWLTVMQTYENGGHMYHTTMPTDALVAARDAMAETRNLGYASAKSRAFELGSKCREMFDTKGLKSVAAPGFEAPGVVVVYTDDGGIFNKFIDQGTQVAGGVPWMLGEPEGNATFRIGLFGLDKLKSPALTVAALEDVYDKVAPAEAAEATA